MDSRSYAYTKPEVELSPRDILWDLLGQWKAVLLVAILFSLAIPGAKLLRDSKNYEAALVQARNEQQNADLSPEETAEQVLASLSNEDREVVATLIEQRKLVQTQTEYLNNSLLLNSDPANQHTLVLKYLLSSDDGTEMSPLVEAYITLLKKDAVVRKVGDVIDSSASLTAISELYSMSYSNIPDSDARELVVAINVILPSENVDIAGLSRVIDTAINDIKSNTTDALGRHDITLLDKNEVYSYNEAALNRKQNLLTCINTNRAAIKTNTGALNSNQRSAFERITSSMDAASSEVPPEGIISASQTGERTENNNGNTPNAPRKPSFSIKYATVGFAIGVMLYTICYVIFTVVRGRVYSEEALCQYTDSRLLGGLYLPLTHRGLSKLFHSRLVDKKRYASKGIPEEQVDEIASTVGAVCEHAGATGASLLRIGIDDDYDISSKVSAALSARGIQSQLINVSTNMDEHLLLDADNAIFLADSTAKADDVWKIVCLTQGYNIAQLGCVFVRTY